MTIPQVFLLVTGLANAVVAFYIFMLVPNTCCASVAWVASRCVYRFQVRGDEHIPVQGAAILACNHVSFVDAVLLMAASPGRSTLSWTTASSGCRCWVRCSGWPRPFRGAQKEDPAVYEAAFERAARCCATATCWPSFRKGHHAGRRVAAVQGRHPEDPGARQG